MYPHWNARDNYRFGLKKKKRKRDRADDPGNGFKQTLLTSFSLFCSGMHCLKMSSRNIMRWLNMNVMFTWKCTQIGQQGKIMPNTKRNAKERTKLGMEPTVFLKKTTRVCPVPLCIIFSFLFYKKNLLSFPVFDFLGVWKNIFLFGKLLYKISFSFFRHCMSICLQSNHFKMFAANFVKDGKYCHFIILILKGLKVLFQWIFVGFFNN